MALTPEQTTLLNSPLDPKHVKAPSGNFGPKGDYLEGWFVINELNRLFGFDGWSYRIDLKQDALEQGQDSKGQPQWQAAYTCVCTLTVGQAVREDVGFGSGFAKQVGDAIEGATKEAATDSLKRCARTFGNIFGLALYDKSRANVQAAPPAVITEDQRQLLVSMFDLTGVPVAPVLKRASQNAGRAITDLRDLPATEYEALHAFLTTKPAKAA